MFGRFIKIAFLFLKLGIAYIFLLLKKKGPNKCMVYASFAKSGGTRTYFFYLVEYLSKKSYDVTVMLTTKQCDEEIKELRLKYPFTIHLLEFEIQPTAFNGTVFYKKKQEEYIYQLQELLYFWKSLGKYKCSRCIISEANPGVLLFLFLSPVKVMYILHTVATDRLDKLKRRMLNYCLSAKKQIITVSEYAKKIIEQNWVNSNNSRYVNVVHNFYEPANKEILLVQGTGSKTLLTIGTVVHYKNPLFWIDVCKEISRQYVGPIDFIWAGDGELLEECRKASAGMADIKFVGYKKDVETLYTGCDIYYQPSILESHGMAVLGAMYFEKPCVVSDRQGLPESVVNNVTGLIVPVEDPQDSVNAILTLLNNTNKATQFGNAAKERITNDFNKSKWYKEMDVIFK